ncbi:MAG: FCD domain-containing protein [Xanthobacteraceae bacterium]|nr:FCD domain-containing protein [Xanthobacteraceae bacterium]
MATETSTRNSRQKTRQQPQASGGGRIGAARKSGPPQWQVVRNEPAACRIERQIKAAILGGRFQAGDYLGSEHDLSAELGVSRLPVREALGRLQALGLVEVKTGAAGGARVAAGRPENIAELLAIQLVLDGLDAEQVLVAQRIVEVAAVGMAARAAQAPDITRMQDALARAEQLVDLPVAFTAASMAFHAAVGEASRNGFLSILMRAIALALEQVAAPDTTAQVARRVVGRHRKLLQAIRDRDAEASTRLISRHLDLVHSRIRERIAAARNGSGRAASLMRVAGP